MKTSRSHRIHKTFRLLFALCLAFQAGAAWSDGAPVYQKPAPFAFIRNIPGDYKDAWNLTFQKRNILGAAVLAGTTGLLIANDQSILDKSYKLGDRWNIPHTNTGKNLIKTKIPFSSKPLAIRLPYDLGSGLYFLGDGTLHLIIAGSFLSVGAIADDNRARQTASQIVEAYLANGLAVQVLKRSTGHESPSHSSENGGEWRFFPSPAKYQKTVPRYDAFPSGHLSSAMAVVTVIGENYGEYKFVRPVGYTLVGLLGFQMLNNGVHWAGDYPLALATGYIFGKVAANRGRKPAQQSASADFTVSPMVMEHSGAGLQIALRFSGHQDNKTN